MTFQFTSVLDEQDKAQLEAHGEPLRQLYRLAMVDVHVRGYLEAWKRGESESFEQTLVDIIKGLVREAHTEVEV